MLLVQEGRVLVTGLPLVMPINPRIPRIDRMEMGGLDLDNSPGWAGGADSLTSACWETRNASGYPKSWASTGRELCEAL